MSVRPVLLKDIRRTPINNHMANTGKGNYNRFEMLAPRDRVFSNGKRQLPRDNPDPPPKSPRFDSNVVFDQLKAQEATMQEARSLLDKATKTGEDCCSASDGGMGTTILTMKQMMALLLKSHENLTLVLIDSTKLNQSAPKQACNRTGGAAAKPDNFIATVTGPTDTISAEDAAKKRIKASLRDAEKKSIIFNLDLGKIPTINKETLSRKVSLALSDKAKTGNHNYHLGDAEEAIDDALNCSKLEFLGAGSKNFFNKHKPDDKRNNTFCTVLVRLDFKDKETRMQAEISLRKLRKVSCSTPYPRRLRGLLNNLVKDGKTKAPDYYIRTRFNVEKLTIDVHAKVGSTWQELHLNYPIPLDILEPITLSTDQELMEESKAASLS